MGNVNNSIDIPPPPPEGIGALRTEVQPGLILRIENALVDISHTYRNSTSPEVNCLIAVQVRKKGNISLRWADSAYQDSRIDNVNRKIADNTMIIISALEIKLFNAAMKEGSDAFWAANKMVKQSPPPNAPDTEYWNGNIEGVTCEIKLMNGRLKVVDMI